MQMETQKQNSDRHQKRPTPLIVCVVATALALLFILPILPDSAAPPNDFAFYWTAARLVLDGKNPYSVADAVDLQQRLFAGDRALVMLNPPWILPLIAPFGVMPFSTGKPLWLVMGLAIMLISVHWLWDLYRDSESRWIGWLVAATFLPVAVVLAIGQIGPLILFGLAGYLRFQTRQKNYLAGAFLFLAALKPHLVFLVRVALLLYALHHKRWESLAAFLPVLGVTSLLAVVLKHHPRSAVCYVTSPVLLRCSSFPSQVPPFGLQSTGIAGALVGSGAPGCPACCWSQSWQHHTRGFLIRWFYCPSSSLRPCRYFVPEGASGSKPRSCILP